MSPRGGYLFLYPGSMSRMFLLAMDDSQPLLVPSGAQQRERRLHTGLTTKAREGAGTRPVNLRNELRELICEVPFIAHASAMLDHEVASDAHERVYAHALA